MGIEGAIKLGDRFYDERNGRCLTIDSIDTGSHTVYAYIEEYDYEDNELYITGRGVFNISELKHFNKMGRA